MPDLTIEDRMAPTGMIWVCPTCKCVSVDKCGDFLSDWTVNCFMVAELYRKSDLVLDNRLRVVSYRTETPA